MAEPDNMILVLLREIRAEMNSRFDAMTGDMNNRFNNVDNRFERLEKKLESVKQAAFGESVLGRYAVAEVENRFDTIEQRLEKLERSRP